MAKKKTQPLFDMWTTVGLQAAVIFGLISGWLSFLVVPSLPAAACAGLAAGCMAAVVLHRLIDET